MPAPNPSRSRSNTAGKLAAELQIESALARRREYPLGDKLADPAVSQVEVSSQFDLRN
jgi:hypothetical protein